VLGCNINPAYTPAPVTLPVQNIPVPGGVTDAIQMGTTLFVTGQAQYPGGEFGGFLSAIDLTNPTPATTQTYVIGDGTHFRIRIGDAGATGVSNTLWIAARTCGDGEQASQTNGSTGCVTMVPVAANGNAYSVAGSCSTASPAPALPSGYPAPQSCSGIVIEPSQSDAGGVAPITGWYKTYTVEGGKVFIYSTLDGSAISNYNVQVHGFANDIAFIDGTTNTAP
jgi:hypothetical protein